MNPQHIRFPEGHHKVRQCENSICRYHQPRPISPFLGEVSLHLLSQLVSEMKKIYIVEDAQRSSATFIHMWPPSFMFPPTSNLCVVITYHYSRMLNVPWVHVECFELVAAKNITHALAAPLINAFADRRGSALCFPSWLQLTTF